MENDEFKEFYRNEYPFKENVGNDPDESIYTPIQSSGGAPGGGLGGGGIGIAGFQGGGGGASGGGTGGSGDDIYSIIPEPQKPLITWRTLLTLTAKISAPNIIEHPKNGKILTYNGKIIKGVEASYTYIIQAGLIDEYASHLDCVLLDFFVDDKNYTENKQDEALTDFFTKGFLSKDGQSKMRIRTKWQKGHYPPWITTIYLKIIDVNADKESVDNIALTKEFRDTITIKIKNKKITFLKS